MRILVLNANTTDFVTQTAAAEARRVASPGTEIVPATADFGAAIVATRSEHAIAEHAAVVLAARHAPGCDAVVIAVSYDTGLKALREMLDIPVGRHDRGRAAHRPACSAAHRPDRLRQARVADLSRVGRRLRTRRPHRRQARAGEHVGLQAGRLLGARCRTRRDRERPDREGRRREHRPARRRDGRRIAPHRGACAGAGARRHALRDPAGRGAGAHRRAQALDRQLRAAGRAGRVEFPTR